MIYMGDTVVDMHRGGKGWRYCILVDSTRHEIGPGKGTAFWRTGNHFDRLAVSPRTTYMFSCAEDKMVKCWDLEQNKVVRHYHGHLSGVYALALHPTLDLLVTAGRDSVARVWDVRTARAVQVLGGHQNTVGAVLTHAVDPQIVTGSNDCMIKLWDLAAGKRMVSNMKRTFDLFREDAGAEPSPCEAARRIKLNAKIYAEYQSVKDVEAPRVGGAQPRPPNAPEAPTAGEQPEGLASEGAMVLHDDPSSSSSSSSSSSPSSSSASAMSSSALSLVPRQGAASSGRLSISTHLLRHYRTRCTRCSLYESTAGRRRRWFPGPCWK